MPSKADRTEALGGAPAKFAQYKLMLGDEVSTSLLKDVGEVLRDYLDQHNEELVPGPYSGEVWAIYLPRVAQHVRGVFDVVGIWRVIPGQLQLGAKIMFFRRHVNKGLLPVAVVFPRTGRFVINPATVLPPRIVRGR